MAKQHRVRWMKLFPDDFLEDPRAMRLTPIDQAKWLMLLMRMWRLEAVLPDDVSLISNLLGVGRNEAIRFRQQLIERGLLELQGKDLISPRLLKEYGKAHKRYEQLSDAGNKGAAVRYQND